MIKVKEKTEQGKKPIIPLVIGLADTILKKLDFENTINENAEEWDKARWGISPGKLVKALVLSTFTDVRVTLSHLKERLDGIDLGYLIGEEVKEHDINAFNVGRALERIGKGDYNKTYEILALRTCQAYDIETKRTHGDTTTVSFYGEYDMTNMELTEEEREEILQIERGYNKDGRPESKQVVVGQIVNEHGIPIVNRAMDGSTSDVEWNANALDYLDEMKKNGFKTGIFVADSKLVTHDLVSRMNNKETEISFVSRCPANFENKLEHRMIERAYKDGAWTDLGQVGKGEQAARYRGISYKEQVCGKEMRLLVLESSVLMKTAAAALEREELKLEPLKKELEKKEFACMADAEREYIRFKNSKALKLFEPTAKIDEVTKEKWPRGRRNARTRPTVTTTYRVNISQMGRSEPACRQYIHNKSCLMLISNVEDEGTTDQDLLKIYKGQHVVENSFRQLKSPSLASVIYLKNPARIAALEMLLSFALLVRAVIQYRLREGLKTHQEKQPDTPINAGWGGRKLDQPTFKLLYEHSYNCHFVRESPDEYSFSWPDPTTKYRVNSLLRLMGETVASILQ